MDPVDLADELHEIYKLLKTLEHANSQELYDELVTAQGWLARSGELVAEAQYIVDKKRGDAAQGYWQQNVGASILREFLARDCAEEAKLLKLADRLNACLVHRIDSIRTLISFEKHLASKG